MLSTTLNHYFLSQLMLGNRITTSSKFLKNQHSLPSPGSFIMLHSQARQMARIPVISNLKNIGFIIHRSENTADLHTFLRRILPCGAWKNYPAR